MSNRPENDFFALYCPNNPSSNGMPLVRQDAVEAQFVELEPPTVALDFAEHFANLQQNIDQKFDAQSKFMQDGFTHLVRQGQDFDDRLARLENQSQSQVATPVNIEYQTHIQYQPPQQQQDLMPIYQGMFAQQQSIDALAFQGQQTNQAIIQLTNVVNDLAARPVATQSIVYNIDNSKHEENQNVTIHGDNYGNINNSGVQKNGMSLLVFLFCVCGIVVGVHLCAK